MACLPQRDRVAFLSRQSNRPFDFVLIEEELRNRAPACPLEWACVREGGKLGVGMFLRQLWLVATSRVCLVDGYVPAVSIPRSHRSTCIQLWHAVGAIKKFGYQCLDTPAGRSSEDARVFRMHCGYDYIVAGMPGAVPAFSDAFGVPESDIRAWGLPRLDYLSSPRFELRRQDDSARVRRRLGIPEDSDELVVLYAPTFRRGVREDDWLSECVAELSRGFAGSNARIVVAGHPLEESEFGECEGSERARVQALRGPTIEALAIADIVISDYSAVALEAGFIGKQVLFYVPDIRQYRMNPGLNIDPEEAFPANSFSDARQLANAALAGIRHDDFQSFMRNYGGSPSGSSLDVIVDAVLDKR